VESHWHDWNHGAYKMAGPSGDESSEEETATKKEELTKVEQGLLEKFGGQLDTAITMVHDWLDKCKDYKNQTRDVLFGHYRVMEDHMLEVLNTNKVEMKEKSKVLRQLMSQRRLSIRELWHKERLNYMQLDLLLQMKVDEASFKKGIEDAAVLQN
jgi:hypothetical protein